VLVDWNGDGDWNDVTECSQRRLLPSRVGGEEPAGDAGAGMQHVPGAGQVGERLGEAWMRVTLTPGTVLNDFPWNGSLGEPNHNYAGGETEDYPVRIAPSVVGVIPATPGTTRVRATDAKPGARDHDPAVRAAEGGRRVRCAPTT
jgi:hypothetical protein